MKTSDDPLIATGQAFLGMLGIGAVVAVVVMILATAFYHLNPHDWDCSKHGGMSENSYVCKDGYRP